MSSSAFLRRPSSQTGRRRGGGVVPAGRKETPNFRAQSPARGEVLMELKPDDIKDVKNNSKIKDCKYVASYNWLDGEDPKIAVPGTPPLWNPPAIPRELELDSGDFFRDLNAARYPSCPLVPAAQAVRELATQFPTQDVDVFTCADTLCKLARFNCGEEQTFRIILTKIGNTLFMIRRENSPDELIPEVKGYGHTFPNAYTLWEQDVKTSVSHQRIIHYGFGGLRLLVRFEVDGYYGGEKDSDPLMTGADKLLSQLKHNFLHGHIAPFGEDGLQISRTGRGAVAQGSIFEIKTRNAFDFNTWTTKKVIDTSVLIPKLYFCQVPTLMAGFHTQGTFKDIDKMDMRPATEQWEANNAENLGRLASLLYRLVDIAKASQTSLELCRSDMGPLEIRRVTGEVCDEIPASLRSWWLGEDSPPMQESNNSDDAPAVGQADYGDGHESDEYDHCSYSDHAAGDKGNDSDDSWIDFTAC
ncbi:hypothetical protein KCU88_g1634, partial [Aureobasidium melanogenum]